MSAVLYLFSTADTFTDTNNKVRYYWIKKHGLVMTFSVK